MKTAMAMAVALLATITLADSVFESNTVPSATTQIDKLVFNRLARLNVHPVLCSDAVFVRRAYLDAIGTLPTAQEARDFIRDPDTKNKRRLLVDRLLERPEFADYWAMKWGDILRIKAEFPVNLWPNAAQAYHRWVRASIAENKPYDKFAREMLTASGSNFRVGPVNFYRAIQSRTPEGIAAAVSLTFMGTLAEVWPANYLAGMAAFFSQVGYKPTSEWKEEVVFWDPVGASTVPGQSAPGRDAIVTPGAATNPPPATVMVSTNRPPAMGLFQDNTKVKLPPNKEPREIFADWLVNPRNPWFARNAVNRIWYWLLGRGIVHEPDDNRRENLPSNPELLAYLERELITAKYDMKHIYRLILNSQTYQLSSMPRYANNPQAEANFAGYPLRRLDAEVLIDAINDITGTTDLYTSAIPEPFTYIPENLPAIAIADGSITSPFLTLFGQSARATGMVSERDNKPVPGQWLHMLNSSHIQRKIEQSAKLKAIYYNSTRKPPEIIEDLYLTILSRFPTAEEIATAEAYGAPVQQKTSQKKDGQKKYGQQKRWEDWVDITWSLLNSSEFLYRH